MERNRRTQTRNNIAVPVFYTREYDNVFHEGLTHDISPGGMSFASGQKFSNGDCFLIKSPASIPGPETAPQGAAVSPGDVCTAQVKWCSKERMDSGYRVGVGLNPEGNSVDSKKRTIAPYHLHCELCGTFPAGDVIKTVDDVSLCPDCFSNFHPLGESLKEKMIRFMIGNVI